MKKYLIIIVSVLSFFICNSNIYAQEIEEEGVISSIEYIYSQEGIDKSVENIGVTPYYPFKDFNFTKGQNVPNQTWEFNNSGRYYMSGGSSYHDLYTNWNFKDASTMAISVTPTKVGSITVQLYKKNFLISDTFITSFVAAYSSGGQTTTLVTVTNLNPNSKYYVKLIAPCYFEGYVDKVN